ACPRCQTEIVKIQLGGRGTHFCPKCQVKHG
ncbi:zinc finger domain-containing protein, partial [Streptococcus suis]